MFKKLLGEEGDKISFEDIIGGYQRVKNDFHQYAVGAEDVIAAVFLELHKVRNTKVVIHLTFNVIVKEVTEAYKNCEVFWQFALIVTRSYLPGYDNMFILWNDS